MATNRSPGVPTPIDITKRGFVLQWQGPLENHEEVLHYELHYKAETDQNWCTDIRRKEFAKLTGLPTNVGYVFKVRAITHAGPGPFSKESTQYRTGDKIAPPRLGMQTLNQTVGTQQVYTGPKPPTSPKPKILQKPKTLEKISATDSSLTIGWSISQNSSFRLYEVNYRRKGDKDWISLYHPQLKACISNLQGAYDYVVKVRGMNESGLGPFSEEHTFSLQTSISPKPTPPHDIHIADVSQNSISLKWACKSGGQKHEVHYQECSSGTWNVVSSYAESTSVEPLLPDTEYIFKIRTHVGQHIGEFSHTTEPIRTLKALPCVPGVPQKQSISDTSITIKWTSPNMGQYSDNSLYEVHYQEHTSGSWQTQTTRDTTLTITGLKTSRGYLFKVRAVDGGMTGPFSNVSAIIETKKIQPVLPTPSVQMQKPGKPNTTWKTQDTLMVTWSPGPGDDDSGLYELVYRKPEDDSWGQSTYHTKTEATITKLQNGTDYIVKVRKLNEGGPGQWSEESDINKKTNPLGQPGIPNVISIADGCFQIRWDAPEIGSQHIRLYELSYISTDDKEWQSKIVQGCERQAFIHNLSKNEAYKFKVRVISEIGKGPFSDISQFPVKSEEQNPEIPGAPQLQGIGADFIHVKWEKAQHGEQCNMYELQYRKTTEATWTSQYCTTNDMMATDLVQNQNYVFRVKGMNKLGASAFSSDSEPICTSLIRRGRLSLSDTSATLRKADPNNIPTSVILAPKPGKPYDITVTPTSITLAWTKPSQCFSPVQGYEIQYKAELEQTWKSERTSEKSMTISSLNEMTKYKFRVKAICNDVAGELSDTSDLISTTRDQLAKPGKPFCESVKNKCVIMSWPEPSTDKILAYQLSYRSTNTNNWLKIDIPDDRNLHTFHDLPLMSEFLFRVKAQFATGWSDFSDVSEPVFTGKEELDTPGVPVMANCSHDCMTVKWQSVVSKHYDIRMYEIYYKRQSDNNWETLNANKPEITVVHLAPGTRYIFKIRAVFREENGAFGPESEALCTKCEPLGEPGIPQLTETREDSLGISWTPPPKTEHRTMRYEVMYSLKGEESWTSSALEEPMASLGPLKADSHYVFKVCAVDEENEKGPFSKTSEPFTTKNKGSAYVDVMLEKAKLLEAHVQKPKIYEIPLTLLRESEMSKVYALKQPTSSKQRERVIMLVGATGSGKTTMINGLANYVLGVNFKNDFRVKLIRETAQELENKKDTTISETEAITAYKLNLGEEALLSYDLTIIDTPGFGDTRGIARDQKTVDQIKDFFTGKNNEGIQHLDAVCFVVQSPEGRLTPTQKFIFEKILHIFGKDIKDNMFVCVTFADGNDPPCIAAIRAAGVPFVEFFKMNNSALYNSNISGQADVTELFWEMGKKSVTHFLQVINKVQSKSLILTIEVLAEREKLEVQVEGLQKLMNEHLAKWNDIEKEYKILKDHEAEIKDNKDFEYEVEESVAKHEILPPGIHVTNCLTCNFTCHDNCIYADDGDKNKCSAMDTAGNCTVCSKKCVWKLHKNMTYKFKIVKKKVKKTYNEKKKKYQDAQKGKSINIDVFACMKKDLTEIKKSVCKKVQEINECLNRLREIALKPDYLTTTGYVDILIESERKQAKYGWQDRMKALEEIREKAELVEKIGKGEITEDQLMWSDDDEGDPNMLATNKKPRKKGIHKLWAGIKDKVKNT